MFTQKNLLILIIRNTLISIAVVFCATVSIIIIKNKIEKTTDSVVLNQKLETELKKRIELFSLIEQNSKLIGKNYIEIDNAFINSNDISKFTNTLDDIATKNTIKQIYYFETPIASLISETYPVSTIIYSNNTTANIKTFSNYLKDFEKIPFFTKIEGFSISSQDKSGWVGPSNISMKSILFTKTTQ